MTNNVENQMKDLARQRDHRELVDMLANFLEEVRKYSRLMASEVPQIAEPLVQVSWHCHILCLWREFNVWQTEVLDVDGGQSVLPVGSASVPSPVRSKSADSEYLKLPALSGVLTDCSVHRSLGEGLQGQRAGHH
jgi:hypothetical protein